MFLPHPREEALSATQIIGDLSEDFYGLHAFLTRAGGMDACYLPQRRLRLRQIERHVHGAVQVNGSGQGSVGLVRPARLAVQDAEAEVESIGYRRREDILCPCLDGGEHGHLPACR